MIIEINDVMDELILQVVQNDQRYFILTDEYIDYLIHSLDATKTIDDIPTPTPYKVKELAVAFIGLKVCSDKFAGQVGLVFKDGEGNDRWYSKLKHYERLHNELENAMTSELMLGTSAKGKSSNVIPLWRG